MVNTRGSSKLLIGVTRPLLDDSRGPQPLETPPIEYLLSQRGDRVLVLFVLLEVVEAEGEDLEDDLKEDLHPVVFLVFSLLFHCGKN